VDSKLGAEDGLVLGWPLGEEQGSLGSTLDFHFRRRARNRAGRNWSSELEGTGLPEQNW
jgi:hypothetical protein